MDINQVHPFIGDLSSKTVDELGETISQLHSRLAWAQQTHKYHMVNQIQMILNSYRSIYNQKQQELWAKKTGKDLSNNIDIR